MKDFLEQKLSHLSTETRFQLAVVKEDESRMGSESFYMKMGNIFAYRFESDNWKDKINEVSRELKEVLETEARVSGRNIYSLTKAEIKESGKIAEEKKHSHQWRSGTPISLRINRNLHHQHHGHEA